MTDTWEAYRDYLFDAPTPSAIAGSAGSAGCTGYTSLWDAVCAEPNQPWDYWKLSRHPELTWEVVRRLAHKGWNWAALSQHSGLEFGLIREHSDKAWDWDALSEHPNISLEVIEENPDYFWKFRTRVVPMKILLKCPRYKMNIYEALFIPWPIILGNLDGKWNWGRLSQRGDLTWEHVLQHPDLPWDYGYLTTRPDVKLDIVEKLPDKSWEWRRLTWEFAKKGYAFLLTFPDKPWDYEWLSHREDLDWEVFWKLSSMALPVKPTWNYAALFTQSGNIDLLIRLPEVPWDFKKKNLYKTLSWDTIRRCMEETGGRLRFPWDAMSRRTDIPWGLVMHTMNDWPWCWRSLTGHPGLTLRFYSAHPEFAWSHGWARQRFREAATRRIQCHWRRCVANPAFLVCRQRLMREFEGIKEDLNGL